MVVLSSTVMSGPQEQINKVERKSSGTSSTSSSSPPPHSSTPSLDRPSSSNSRKTRHDRLEKRSSSSLSSAHRPIERPSSSLSEKSKRPRKEGGRKEISGDEPRALKKRFKEKRSKSADYRLKNKPSINDHNLPKSKDDLDHGHFTVLGRPNNPWGALKRNKSVPNLVRSTIKVNLSENIRKKPLTVSKSTPDLREKSENRDIEKPAPLERKRSTHTIYIKSAKVTQIEREEEIKLTKVTKSRVENKQTSTCVVQIGETEKSPHKEGKEEEPEKEEEKETYQSKVLSEQKELLLEAQQFQKTCEDLLEDIEVHPTPKVNNNKSDSSFNKETVNERVSSNILTEEFVSKEESKESIRQEKQTRRIVIKNIDFDLSEDLHEQGIKIIKDFIHQLIFEHNIQGIVSIKKYADSAEIEFQSDLSEDEIMYRKSLNQQDLGLERHSSMPEMSRDEFLEKREKKQQGDLKRNNSFTNINNEKKRVIKTKVSSRLLQATAASSRKQKTKIQYVPPPKKSDQQWIDRPLKNVESGFTTQTFVKYYGAEKPREVMNAENVITDEHEKYEWRSDNGGFIDIGTAYSMENHKHYQDENNNNTSKKVTSQENYVVSSTNITKLRMKGATSPERLSRTPLSGTEDDTGDDEQEDPRKLQTGYFSAPSAPYEPFTTFSKQGHVFSSTSSSTIHDSKTFNYVYTIDAELSYREYNKLMNIINLLQEQKKKWEEEVTEVRDKLEKTGKEKMQLAHNNHILRQSLEAANRAIKEINSKVQELKQTLVPLREDNTTLKEENEELKNTIEFVKKERSVITNEVEEYRKMKLVYEEQLSYKDGEIEDYKRSMHEKFRKLEDAYKVYRDDMEMKHRNLLMEVEELRIANENLKRELELLKNENQDLKEEIEELQRKNEKLELDLKKQKIIDEQLQNANKETKLLTENTEELEKMYKGEIEKASKEIERTRDEIDRYKEETRALEGENDRLKFDIENLENRLKDIESTGKMKDHAREFEVQQNEILKNELEELKKQLVELGALKQEKVMFNEEKHMYKSQLESLQNQVMEYEKLKRESFINQHENQRLKSELERLKLENQGMEENLREHASNAAENQRLKSELQNLKQQLSLLEDKQKYISSPYNDEIKTELENIRNQMKELAVKNQEKKIDIYTDELKGELESLRNQIKDLDQLNREQPIQQSSIIVKESNSTVSVSEKEKISERVIYIRDQQGNLREAKADDFPGNSKQDNEAVVEEVVQAVDDRQVESANPIGESVQGPSSNDQSKYGKNADQSIYQSNMEESNRSINQSNMEESNRLKERRNQTGKGDGQINGAEDSFNKDQTDNRNKPGKSESKSIKTDPENETEKKQKQIEDRIRRKREQQTGWQLRTPDIYKLKRSSMENLDDEENYDTDEHTGRTRSRSAGRRAVSADRRRRNESEDRLSIPFQRSGSLRYHKKERGRSPHRRNRDVISQQQQQHDVYSKNDVHHSQHETSTKPAQKYKVEVTVDNSHGTTERTREIRQLMHQSTSHESRDVETSPNRVRRRIKSGERRESKERLRNTSRYDEDSSSEIDEQRPRRKQSKPRDQLRSGYDASVDMLQEAMRSRQEQAITNKFGKNHPKSYKQPSEVPYTGLLITKGSQHDQSRPPPPHHHHHYGNINTERKNVASSNHQTMHKLQTSDNSMVYYHSLPFEKPHAPVKPKRTFETDRGYLTDSAALIKSEEKMKSSHSQSHLHQQRAYRADGYDRSDGHKHGSPVVQNLRSDQALKLILKPVVHADEAKYAKVEKKSSVKYRNLSEEDQVQMQRMEKARQKHRSLSEDEQVQMQRMEKARQKSLHKSNNASEESKAAVQQNHTSSNMSRGVVITRGGVPLQRSRHSLEKDGHHRNSFITEQEADAMFNQAVQQASTGVVSSRVVQERYKENKTHTSAKGKNKSDDIIRTSSWSHGTESRHSHGIDQSQRTYSIPRKPTVELLEHHHRSYRDTKLNDVKHRQDDVKRLSAISNDSLGGFSQITYTTVDESKYNSRYDDYATQIDDDVDARHHHRHQKDRQNGIQHSRHHQEHFDESEILKRAKNIPSGHSKFRCEKCRELNVRSRTGEPIRYCWERYYPISETTPRASVQSLQHI